MLAWPGEGGALGHPCPESGGFEAVSGKKGTERKRFPGRVGSGHRTTPPRPARAPEAPPPAPTEKPEDSARLRGGQRGADFGRRPRPQGPSGHPFGWSAPVMPGVRGPPRGEQGAPGTQHPAEGWGRSAAPCTGGRAGAGAPGGQSGARLETHRTREEDADELYLIPASPHLGDSGACGLPGVPGALPPDTEGGLGFSGEDESLENPGWS